RVFASGPVPREVLGDRVRNQTPTRRDILPARDGSLDGRHERFEPMRSEAEAGPGARARAELDDRVVQTPDVVDDGDGAVAKAVELVEPAGLEAGGHQEDVSPGLEAMGETLVEPDPYGDPVAMRAGEVCERGLVVTFAAAEDRHRAGGGGEQAGHRGDDQ